METVGIIAENIRSGGANEMLGQPCVYILYGTHTGNSEHLAKDAIEKLAAAGLVALACDMGDFKPEMLERIHRLLIIVSTDGEGEPPLMAEELLEYLYSDKAPALNHISYSVLALGDSCYDDFCQAGKDFDSILEILGAHRIYSRVDCDVDFDKNYADWLSEVISYWL